MLLRLIAITTKEVRQLARDRLTFGMIIGIPLMLFYAVLISIPEELEEAATVDGASGWSTFWHIKFPLILPTVGIVAILTYVCNDTATTSIYGYYNGSSPHDARPSSGR